jgi:hypothetical protein
MHLPFLSLSDKCMLRSLPPVCSLSLTLLNKGFQTIDRRSDSHRLWILLLTRKMYLYDLGTGHLTEDSRVTGFDNHSHLIATIPAPIPYSDYLCKQFHRIVPSFLADSVLDESTFSVVVIDQRRRSTLTWKDLVRVQEWPRFVLRSRSVCNTTLNCVTIKDKNDQLYRNVLTMI